VIGGSWVKVPSEQEQEQEGKVGSKVLNTALSFHVL
jgi:hypothetical protein